MIENTLREAADMIGTVLGVEPMDETTWLVIFGEEDVVVATHDNDQEKIFFRRSIGTPRPEDADRLAGLMLAFNYLSESVGGMRIGVAGAGGEAALLADLSTHNLTPPRLVSVIETMIQRGAAWQQLLTDPVIADAEAAAEDGPTDLSGMVQV